MKSKTIFLLCLGIFLSESTLGQEYINETSQWYYNWKFYDLHQHSGTTKYTVSGIEDINDTTYFSLEYLLIDSAVWNGSLFYVDTIVDFAGFLREEDKKFYFRYSTEQNEFLLNDFNLGIGDTIPHIFSAIPLDTFLIVTSIETLSSELGGLNRKRYFTDFNDIQIIEGIGNSRTWRMPEYYLDEWLTEYNNNNICYSMNGENLQINDGIDCQLDPITSTKDLIIPDYNLRIFPNPFHEFSTLEIDQNLSSSYDILIFNSIGRLVFEDKGIIYPTYQLSRKNLIPGVYFIQVKQAGRIIGISKFVISG